jgi:hypothetical protein
MRRVVGAALGLGLIVGMWPAEVSAHDHRLPRVKVFTGSDRQSANILTYTWAEKQGRFCSLEHGDGFYSYPFAADYSIGDRVRIRFRKRQKPKDVDIRQYRELNRHGAPKGDGRWKFFTLKRVIVDGHVRWEARFDINRPGHHYFDITASWRDVGGCGLQSGYWLAHVKAVRA